MFRKHTAITLLIVGLILTITILFIQQYNLRQEPKIYCFDVETVDFRIKNIEFVVYNNSKSIYVTDHYLEFIGNDKKFSGISYNISIDGESILSVSQADDPFTLPDASNGRKYYTTRSLLENIKIQDTDTIKIEINYEVNGETKKVDTRVILKNFTKPFSYTVNNNVIRL